MGRATFGRVDARAVLGRLQRAGVNYSADQVRRPTWNFDTHRTDLPAESPGPPEPGGSWQTACRLLAAYEFTVPNLVRAVYDPQDSLLGRDMLLQARFFRLHFYCGVRVTDVVEESRADGCTAWGWSYETLEGHLERGKITYGIVKHEDTGRVEFVINSFSQGAPGIGPVVRLGWRVFGRWTQLRFYRGCGQRMRTLVEQNKDGAWSLPEPTRVDGLVLAPSDVGASRLDGLALTRVLPG